MFGDNDGERPRFPTDCRPHHGSGCLAINGRGAGLAPAGPVEPPLRRMEQLPEAVVAPGQDAVSRLWL